MSWLTGLQAMLVYLVPLVIGRAVVLALFGRPIDSLAAKVRAKLAGLKWFVGNESKYQGLLLVPYYFGLGSLMVLAVAMVSQYLIYPWLGIGFERVFFPLVWLMVFVSLLENLIRWPRGWWGQLKKLVAPALALGLMAGVAYGLWLYKSPYPLNWDWYQHQTLAGLIQEGNFSFLASEVSDTFGFNSYPPMFHLLTAVAQYPRELAPNYVIEFWQWVSFYHLLTVGVASWWLGQVVMRKPLAGFLSGALGVLVFDSAVSFTSFFWLPQTMAAVLFVLMFVGLLSVVGRGRRLSWWKTSVAVMILPMFHYLIGGLAALVFLGVDVFARLRKKFPEVSVGLPLVSVVVLTVVVGALFSGHVDLNELNRGEAGFYTFSLVEKQGFLEHAYGYGAYLWLPLGIVFALTKKDRRHEVSLLLLFGFIAVLLSGFPYVLKFFTLARFWVNLFMVIGVLGVLSYVKSKWLKWMAALGVVGMILVMLVVNANFWKAGALYQGEYSHISKDDIEVAEILRENYKDGVLLISDPATQFILEGLSGTNSLGGAYMSIEDRKVLGKALVDSGPEEFVKAIEGLEDLLLPGADEKLVAVSARSFVWARADEKDRLSFAFSVWSPLNFSVNDLKRLKEIEKSNNLEKIYESLYVVLYRVK